MSDVCTVEPAAEPLGDSQLLFFPHLRTVDGFVHAVTTRPWNMAPHRGPQAERAVERRRRVCEALGLPFEHLTCPNQVHSPHVLRVEPRDVGAGRASREAALNFVDGLVCDLPDVPVMQFSADCPILLLVDPRHRAFGTAHASWRGTVTRIAGELVRRMREQFDTRPADLLAAIAPCAGPDEYEVGDDVRRIAMTRLADGERFFTERGAKWTFDMRAANAAQLVEAGVPVDRIVAASPSTMSDPRFYSHRRDGPDTGRFALIAAIRS